MGYKGGMVYGTIEGIVRIQALNRRIFLQEAYTLHGPAPGRAQAQPGRFAGEGGKEGMGSPCKVYAPYVDAYTYLHMYQYIYIYTQIHIYCCYTIAYEPVLSHVILWKLMESHGISDTCVYICWHI